MSYGTLKFDTLTTSDAKKSSAVKSIDTSFLLNGTSISWWQYDQENVETDGSFNVSSISDDATGRYTPTLTTAQNNVTDRAVNVTSNHDSGDSYARNSAIQHDSGGSYTTSAISVETYYGAFTLTDNKHDFGTVYGGLA